MASRYWIKLYHEILEDPKMGRLPHRAWRRCIELFLLAGTSGNDGHLPSLSDIAWRLRTSEEELASDMEVLASAGIVTSGEGGRYVVTNFAKRQEAIAATERKRQQRKRDRTSHFSDNEPVTKREEARHEPVTFRDTEPEPEPEPDTESDTESEETRQETDNRTSSSSDFTAGAIRAFENTIGIIAGAHQTDEIRGTLQELEAEGLQDWWQAALNIAADQNKRSWAYVRGILRNCLREGRAPAPRARSERAPPDEPAGFQAIRELGNEEGWKDGFT